MSARLPRRLRRVTTAATAVLAVLVPAAQFAAAPAAGAQPTSDTADTGSGPTPPPLEGNPAPPRDDGRPDVPYTPKTDGCIRTLPNDVPLQTIPWGQNVLQFDELHRFATGQGQTIAVIDTGVNRHDYLGNRVAGGGDYVQQNGDGLNDCDGHGTEVAGIIAANPRDGKIGFKGIAYNARILSIRQSSDRFEYKPQNQNDRSGREKAGSLTTLAKAVVNAANRDVDVINMSVDTCRDADQPITPPELELQRALRYAVEDRDVVVVASAGNTPAPGCDRQNETQNSADPEHPRYIVTPPWFSEYVLSVAAVERDGSVADFSMHGPWVSVAAPGTDMISLDPGNNDQLANQSPSPTGELGPIQGTSFAAPYVAGLAALVREEFEERGEPLSAREVMDRIKRTASHPAAAEAHDIQVGYGMINPVGALTAKIPGQEGISPDDAVSSPYEVPPAQPRDWTPERVAVIGSGGGLGLLLLTLFILHTVRRQRRNRAGPA